MVNGLDLWPTWPLEAARNLTVCCHGMFFLLYFEPSCEHGHSVCLVFRRLEVRMEVQEMNEEGDYAGVEVSRDSYSDFHEELLLKFIPVFLI